MSSSFRNANPYQMIIPLLPHVNTILMKDSAMLILYLKNNLSVRKRLLNKNLKNK